MKLPTVQIVQVAPSNWKVVATTTGAVLQEDIKLKDEFAALEYVRNYCTSFVSWTYDVVPLKKG